jgi:hypothetical protein
LIAKPARVRASIAGKINDAALMRVFDYFLHHQGGPGGTAHLELVEEGYWIEPIINDEAVDRYERSCARS